VGTNKQTAGYMAKQNGRDRVIKFLDACSSVLVVRSTEEVCLPKDLGRMLVAEMLM
jgi:hypothetical protein